MMRCILTVASHRARTNPIPFTSPVLSPALLGTHILDYNWTMGDLLTLVATKAAAVP